MPETPFLAGFHAQFEMPRPVVVDLVERATGRRVVDVRRMVRGYDNEVYRVGLDDGVFVYPRIRRPGEPGFSQEVWAMDTARHAGIPVPEVLLTDVLAGDEGDRHGMVVAQAPGQQLEAVLDTLSPSQRRTAMVDVGRVLARLHSVPMPGVWRPNDNGHWPEPATLRRGWIADRAAEDWALAAAGLDAEEVKRATCLLPASPDTPPGAGFVLCHGDVSPEHVFVDANFKVSGLIDWGMWHGGSPIGELAYVAMSHQQPDLASILHGHGGGSLDDPDFRRAINLSIVAQVIGHIAHHVTINDTAGTAHNVDVLRRVLAELDHDVIRHSPDQPQ